METIAVKASRQYEVHIGPGLLARTGDFLARMSAAGPSCGCSVSPRTAAVITDSNVDPLYRRTVEDSLQAAGFRVVSFAFPAGETHKNIDTYSAILSVISKSHLTRSDYLVALGGGVTGDLTGFAAATYLRGIPYIQLPTTLLAAVDSSVGGKTAINLETGKNLAGAFCQPSMVLCDTDCFRTLPGEVFREGFAEVIKYAMIGGGDLLRLLESAEGAAALQPAQVGMQAVHEELQSAPEALQIAPAVSKDAPDLLACMVAACVRAKAALVEADEFDRGARRLLNFGHTFGHAIEAASSYTVSHGQAVAIGMAVMTRAAVNKGFCSSETLQYLLRLLYKFHLPSSIDDAERIMEAKLHRQQGGGEFSDAKHSGAECVDVPLTAASLAEIAMSDKKGNGDTISLVVPKETGVCTILSVPQADLVSWLTAGGVR